MSSVSNTFSNPILPGFNPDPSCCFVPGVGYFVATSSFEFFPGLPIYHSKDLNEWKLIGHALNRKSQGIDIRTVETSAGLWAPTFRYNKGTWYMICSCFWRLRINAGKADVISTGFYVKTDDIFDDSKWSDAVYFEEVGFDQDLLFDADGKVYQTVTRFDFNAESTNGHPKIQSWISEMDLETGKSLTEPVLAKASALGVAEGCHIVKHEGWYYFFTAEGGTQNGHRECVYRSKEPTGPFEAPPEGVNPLIFNDTHPDIQNTGHMDIMQGDDGKWVAVFLGVRPVYEAVVGDAGLGMPTHLGRETFMAPMEWVDGWPVVNGRKKIELVTEFEGLDLKKGKQSWVDNFDQDVLAMGWYHIRIPFRQHYSLTEKPGYLALRGAPDKITVEHAPAVLLQKQVGWDLDWSTELLFEPSKPGQEAGTVVWMSAASHAVLGIRGVEGGKTELVFRIEDKEKPSEQTFPLASPENAVTLSVVARKHDYTLSFTEAGSESKTVGSFGTDALRPLFTGAHLGIYAQGVNETPSLNSAFFKYARWDIVPST